MGCHADAANSGSDDQHVKIRGCRQHSTLHLQRVKKAQHEGQSESSLQFETQYPAKAAVHRTL
ncbi:Monooxygenase, flavin-binding family [Altererythrobacter epoxidivorans]|uniref:Monooxygenase, flavin-binding family n=1 Tax=Altererythrobacter epoxidivorans TaxID=361183 RepID=A0A0M4LWL9_9SPHN|nr:Monooxygenase, flavin-binding family [Altererythrobacter epoxidivorans]